MKALNVLGDKRCDNINDMPRNQNTPDELETVERTVSVNVTLHMLNLSQEPVYLRH